MLLHPDVDTQLQEEKIDSEQASAVLDAGGAQMSEFSQMQALTVSPSPRKLFLQSALVLMDSQVWPIFVLFMLSQKSRQGCGVAVVEVLLVELVDVDVNQVLL
mmetsp:Transcript_67881/g.126841  ORF Transcript_67881/g.126841 Transcript_67881/m.126841 type:complete len:103 (+) Transcript_67881:257-565(+)